MNSALKTLVTPLGGETYHIIQDAHGVEVILTYNDLWMLIVCRTSLDSDWIRAREAAGLIMDAPRKQQIVDRLRELDKVLGGLPNIPDDVLALHLQRAHRWFKQKPVNYARKW
jgi:hypothetical protein